MNFAEYRKLCTSNCTKEELPDIDKVNYKRYNIDSFLLTQDDLDGKNLLFESDRISLKNLIENSGQQLNVGDNIILLYSCNTLNEIDNLQITEINRQNITGRHE